MFDIKLSFSDLSEIIVCITIANEDLAGADGGNETCQRLIDEIFRQYRAQLGHHEKEVIPDAD